jgi:hypothetical protein
MGSSTGNAPAALRFGGLSTRYKHFVLSLALLQPILGVRALADPAPPGEERATGAALRPGATALGAGTIFLTRVAIDAPASGTAFISSGQLLPSLDEPVGSCRLKLRVAGAKLPTGTPLTVVSVTSTTAPSEDRGISSVTWRFGPEDPAESLLCDTVGNLGLTQGDVEAELKGVLQVEGSEPPVE